MFIWLESWLGRGSTNELQDCDTEDLAAAVAHELAHAVRCALPSTQPVMYDEGLAVRFSLDAVPECR